MYRLTVSGPVVQTVQNKWKQTLPQWIRIYRWANVWGEYCKNTDEWLCEIRKSVGTYDDNVTIAILETIEPQMALAPPYDIDDMWEEEVVRNDNHSCGNLLVLTGMPRDIFVACKEYDIPIGDWLRQYIQEEPLHADKPAQARKSLHADKPVHAHKPVRANRVCHIVEEDSV